MNEEEPKPPPWAENEEKVEQQTVKKIEPPENSKNQIIVSKVLEKLGRPKNYFKSVVKNVYGNRYRINVLVQKTSGLSGLIHVEMSDSFFLHISSEGEIVYANPKITRRY